MKKNTMIMLNDFCDTRPERAEPFINQTFPSKNKYLTLVYKINHPPYIVNH